MDLLNSITTGTISAKTQPLSCPAYLPGEAVGIREDIAPLNTISYFSNGSIVRLYTDPIEPRFCSGPSQVSLAVQRYFHAMLTSGLGRVLINLRRYPVRPH